MLVETYEQTEIYDGEPECEAEAVELIEKLGLQGQQRLLSPSKTERNPYRKMTADELFVYSVLLKEHCRLAEYSDGPIPLRVLQIASHATDLFASLHVWHATSADIKDPILVGIKKHPTETWREERFLLARWGDVLEPLADLTKLAVASIRAQVKNKLLEIKSAVDSRLATIDTLSDEQIVAKGSGQVPSYAD